MYNGFFQIIGQSDQLAAKSDKWMNFVSVNRAYVRRAHQLDICHPGFAAKAGWFNGSKLVRKSQNVKKFYKKQ